MNVNWFWRGRQELGSGAKCKGLRGDEIMWKGSSDNLGLTHVYQIVALMMPQNHLGFMGYVSLQTRLAYSFNTAFDFSNFTISINPLLWNNLLYY